MNWLPTGAQKWYLIAVTFAGGFLLCVPVGGVLIGKITSPLVEQIGTNAMARP